MAQLHPVDALFAGMVEVEPYPSGVVAVKGRIQGTAFFPGGYGLWRPAGTGLPAMPVGGVMVLGQDFHSEAGFRLSLAQGTEVPDPSIRGYRTPATWVALLKLFTEANVPLTRCFFTNAFMGLRESERATGQFPGSRDPGFVERCHSFFLRQLEAQRPSVILTLGVWVPAFLAPLSPELAGWMRVRSMSAIDAAGPLISGVRFSGATATTTVAALTHPSLRGPNVHRRRVGLLDGHAAEVRLLRDVSKSLRLDGGLS